MCTVSFVPLKDSYCITSNRDENVMREKAIPPSKYIINNKEIYFPKDPKAGGTWFAHNKKNCVVLLNGAEEKHIQKQSYKKSRGLIVLELVASENPFKAWEVIDLNGIEPFTIILFSKKKLQQLQWNELKKTTTELDITKHYIWSSSTLYEKEVRVERAKWFEDFMNSEKNITKDKLLDFHQFTEKENTNFGLQINRNDHLKTISITQCNITNSDFIFKYIDLLN